MSAHHVDGDVDIMRMVYGKGEQVDVDFMVAHAMKLRLASTQEAYEIWVRVMSFYRKSNPHLTWPAT